jgi:DNA helicase-2/ATP-dependent DNA helicase PcrA
MEEGLFPISRVAEEPDALEEERRLCYVGMTRAMEELYLTRARRRRRWGQVLDTLPSRFLGEIPGELLTVIDQMRVVATTPGRARSRRPLRAFDEAERVDAMPDYESESQEAFAGFEPGQEVEHATLGKGCVLEVSGEGERTRLIVAFHDAGTRKLMAKYARLKVL